MEKYGLEISKQFESEIASTENAERKIRLMVTYNVYTKVMSFNVVHSTDGTVPFETVEEAVEFFNLIQ